MKTENFNKLLMFLIGLFIGAGFIVAVSEFAGKPNVEQVVSKGNGGDLYLLETKVYIKGKLEYLDEFFGSLHQIDSAKCLNYNEAKEYIVMTKRLNYK